MIVLALKLSRVGESFNDEAPIGGSPAMCYVKVFGLCYVLCKMNSLCAMCYVKVFDFCYVLCKINWPLCYVLCKSFWSLLCAM